MSKESDTEVIEIISSDEDGSSDDDGSSDVELAEEDKHFILDLMTNEYFFQQDSENLGSTYRCKQKCKVCSENKPNFPMDDAVVYELFIQRGETTSLSQDDREAINRDLVHNYFKEKWEARTEKMKMARDQNRTESHRSEGQSDQDQNRRTTNEGEKSHEAPNYVLQTERFRSKSEQEYDQNNMFTSKENKNNKRNEYITSRIRNHNHHGEGTKRIDMIEPDPDVLRSERVRSKDTKEYDKNSMSTNEKGNNVECDDGAEPITMNRTYTVESARGDTRIKRFRDSRISNSTNYVMETNTMSCQQIPLGKYEEHTMKNTYLTEGVNNTKIILESESSGIKKPMDDPACKFFIDREILDVEMYEYGLNNEHWNPTQSLYEISSKCGWERPSYTTTRVDNKKSIFPSFMCAVVTNGKTFTGDKSVTQKKTARHLASAKVLNFIGFEFDYADNEDPVIPIPRKKLIDINTPFSYRLKQDDNSFGSHDEYGSSQRYKETANYSLQQRLGSRKPYRQTRHFFSMKFDRFITKDVSSSLPKHQGNNARWSRSSSPGEELCKRPRKEL